MQNKQLDQLRKDTELQLNGICSMIEDFAKMMEQKEAAIGKNLEDRFNHRFAKLEFMLKESHGRIHEISSACDKSSGSLKS